MDPIRDNGPVPPTRNLVNLESVSKAFGERPLLDEVSTGVNAGERIGVVGRNGAGKSTLLSVMAGDEPVDSGRVSAAADAHIGMLRQNPPFDADATILQAVVGSRATHEWAVDPRVREVLAGLLGGFDDAILDRRLGDLSGGERRRVELARLLVSDLDLLLLDEPTNHLDVEIVAWLAAYLKSRPTLAIVVVTHDRWFLDEVCDRTWEVVGGKVEEYDGGYSAYVLSKAERMRQGAAAEARRNNLLRKELAWLRRGAPARTSKPKFRVDAANELISSEPPPRDAVELLSFADARLGKTVIELHDTSLAMGSHLLFEHLTWNIGPGQRIGILGPNGAGKTSLMRMMLGEVRPTAGRVVTGLTVKPAYLSQHLEELDPTWRVLESVEHVAQRVDLGKGRELTGIAAVRATRLRHGRPVDARGRPVGRRAPPPAADAAAHGCAERPRARRAHERLRRRDPDRPRGPPRRLRRDAAHRLARPVLPRAGVRRLRRPARRRAGAAAHGRRRGLPREATGSGSLPGRRPPLPVAPSASASSQDRDGAEGHGPPRAADREAAGCARWRCTTPSPRTPRTSSASPHCTTSCARSRRERETLEEQWLELVDLSVGLERSAVLSGLTRIPG